MNSRATDCEVLEVILKQTGAQHHLVAFYLNGPPLNFLTNNQAHASQIQQKIVYGELILHCPRLVSSEICGISRANGAAITAF